MERQFGRFIAAAALITILLASCSQLSQEVGNSPVPPSMLSTTARSQHEEFDFQNLFVSVDLAVETTIYDPAGNALDVSSEPIIVTAMTQDDETIYIGAVRGDDTLEAELGISSAWDEIIIAVEKPGWPPERFRVSHPALLSGIELQAHLSEPELQTMISGVQDEDNDGIPDVYDVDWGPEGADSAFAYGVPADGSLTIAYEDNFPHVGDGDFNDFVASYETTVFTDTNDSEKETAIIIDVRARARVAGYDHEFGFVINMPGLRAIALVAVTDPVTGTQTVLQNNVPVSDPAGDGAGIRIPVFLSTKESFTKTGSSPGNVDNGYPEYLNSVGHTARIVLTQIRPIAAEPDPWHVQLPPFDPYLIPQTGYDVHLIGKPALPGSKNYEVPLEEWEDFRDQAGYPRALLVPTDWGHPAETLHIEEAYPDFRAWRESEGEQMSDWFLRPEPGLVVYPPVR